MKVDGLVNGFQFTNNIATVLQERLLDAKNPVR
jgi:hypothetical protein